MKVRTIAVLVGMALLTLVTGTLLVHRANAQASEKKAVDFRLKDLDGKTVRLSDYRGKVVVVDVWATWCGYCVREIPGLIKLQDEATDAKKPLQIIGISVDANRDDVSDFVAKRKINYPVLTARGNNIKPFGDIYGLPTKFIINKDGVIVDKIIGAIEKDDLEKRLAKYL